MRDLILIEIETIKDEQTRAEGTDLARLQGWESALEWVFRRLPEQG